MKAPIVLNILTFMQDQVMRFTLDLAYFSQSASSILPFVRGGKIRTDVQEF